MPVAPSPSGIDTMRQRMARASRTPPPPRKAQEAEAGRKPGQAGEPAGGEPAVAPVQAAVRAPAHRVRGPRVAADAPAANLAIRVRRPLDERLGELIHALRQGGVRTSKVELIEMLLWELPPAPSGELRQRLGAFRAAAPRGSGAPLD